jgi:hypothetical protein
MFIFLEKNRWIIRAETASRTPAKTISRTIVRINPTNPTKTLVLWDNIVLKGVTAGAIPPRHLEKSE